jgi:hypothetical protein
MAISLDGLPDLTPDIGYECCVVVVIAVFHAVSVSKFGRLRFFLSL